MSWDTLTEAQRECLRLGDGAMQRLKKHETVEMWRTVGLALDELQRAALHLAGSNVAKGSAYNRAWGELVSHVQHLRLIDKGTRSHSIWLATNWIEVEAWLGTLTASERLKLSHPTNVHRKFDAARKPQSTAAQDRRDYKKLYEEVQEELEQQRSARPGKAPSRLRPDEFAELLWEENCQRPRFMKDLIDALVQKQAWEAQADAREAKVKSKKKKPAAIADGGDPALLLIGQE